MGDDSTAATWSCAECMFDNPRSAPACEACFVPRPQNLKLHPSALEEGGLIPHYTLENDPLPPPPTPSQLPPEFRDSIAEPPTTTTAGRVSVALPPPTRVSVPPPAPAQETKGMSSEDLGRVRQVSLDAPPRASESESRAPVEKSHTARYCFQCRALSYKNSILMYRNWRSSLCILITPALFVLLIGIVAVSENTSGSGTRNPVDLMCFGPSCTSDSIITKCAIFDSREGRYGYGGLIPDGKCTTLMFAPSDNPEVVSIMTELASRNGLSAPVVGKTSSTSHSEVVNSGDVVGMTTVTELQRWFSSRDNSGWALSAVVFDDPLTTVNTTANSTSLGANIHYEIWYNKSATLSVFGSSWMATAGFDPLALATGKSSVSLKVQRAVNEAIINVRGKSNNTNFNMPLDVALKPFPDFPFVNPNDPPTRIVNFGSLLYFLGLIGIFLFAMVEIVGEKEKAIVLMMRTIGLYESVFWLSWCLYFAVLILFSVLLLLIVGYCFGEAVPFFYSTDFRGLFVLFYMYGISLASFGFFWASLLGTINKAIWAGLMWTLVGLLAQIVFLPMFGSLLILLIHDPYALPRWGLYLAQFYPPIGFGLAIEMVQSATAPQLVLNTATGNVDTVLTQFTWDDFIGAPGTPIATTTYNSFICADPVCIPYTKLPPVAFVNFQIVVFLFWMFWAWFASTVDATNSLFFFLTPSFWLPSHMYKPRAKKGEVPESGGDSDVQAETAACLAGVNRESGVCVVNLHKRFAKHNAVNGLCVSMERNKVFCLLGHNGAGKTTSLNMISGKLPITSGEAYVAGYSVHSELDRVRRVIGVCPQHDVLWFQLTAEEHLKIASLFKGVSPRVSAPMVAEMLESVKLTSVKNKQAGEYSGGMKRRLSVAMSAMGNPSVLFLDEPTTGMDPMNRKHVWDAITRLKQGRVVVLTTHSMEEADAVGDRIGIMSGGKLQAIGTALHLKTKHGLGYLVKLVTTQGARVEAIVKDIMPQAVLTDNSAGSLTYSVPPSALAQMPTLFGWIEETLEKESGLLVDWAVSNTTLEEVFITLARDEHKPAHLTLKNNTAATTKKEAKETPAGEEEGEKKHEMVSAKYNSSGAKPSSYLALFRQRGALQRRQIKTNVCLGCCPALAMLLLLLATWGLDEVSRTFFRNKAAQDAASLARCVTCEQAATAVCGACRQPGANAQTCFDIATNYSVPSSDFDVFSVCAKCQLCAANPADMVAINTTSLSVPCNSSLVNQTCAYAQSMCTCNGTAYRDAVSYSCSSLTYSGFWKDYAAPTRPGQPQCQDYERSTSLVMDDPFLIAGFTNKVESSSNSQTNYFNNDGDSSGVFVAAVLENGGATTLGEQQGGSLGTSTQEALRQGTYYGGSGNNFPQTFQADIASPTFYASLASKQALLNQSGILGLMKQEIIQTGVGQNRLTLKCPLDFSFNGTRFTACDNALSAAYVAYGLSTCINQSTYNNFNVTLTGLVLPPDFVFPPFADVAVNTTCGSVTDLFVNVPFYPSPCDVFQSYDGYPRVNGIPGTACNNASCPVRNGTNCLMESCMGNVSTCRASTNYDCSLAFENQYMNHFYASPEYRPFATANGLSEYVWQMQSDTQARRLPSFARDAHFEASEAVNQRYPAGGLLFHSLSPSRVSVTLQGFYTTIDERTSKYGLVSAQINRSLAPYNITSEVTPSCDPTNSTITDNCYGCAAPTASTLTRQEQTRLETQMLLGVFPAFTRVHLGGFSSTSELSAGNILLDYVSDGILKYFVDSSFSISTSLRPHPYLSDDASAILSAVDTGKSILSELFVGLASSILLAPLMLPVVVEKEKKLRSMMKMMGLSMRSYWCVTYAWSMFFCLCVLFYMLIIAALTGLYQGGNILSRSAGGIILFIMILWAHSQAMLAFLISAFFSRARCVSIFGFLSLIMLVILSLILNQVVFNQASWGGSPSPWYLMLLSPMAYYRTLNLLSRRAYTWDTLGGSELGRNMGFMFLDALIYGLFAWYLDQVLPQEFGVQRSPCFCFTDLFARCAKNKRQVDNGEGGGDKGGLEMDLIKPLDNDGVASEVGVQEDVDVQNERQLVLRRDFDPNAPVQIINLRKVYPGGFVAVESVTLHIDNGECFGLLGPNGAGKTTTISMLTGLFGMSGGDVKLCGFDLQTQLKEIYRIMGVCPQFDICWPELSVEDHLLFYCRVKGVRREVEKNMVRDILQDVGLQKAAKKLARELSGGMQRRLSLAIALVGNPKIVFLDEPTTGLDPETKRNIWALIDSLKAGRCIILTTHSMEEADALCGRIGIMSHGLMRCLGTGIHLKNKYGNGYKIDVRCQVGFKKRAQAFVMSLCPTAVVESSFGETITFQVAKKDVKLSKVFQALLSRPQEMGIVDYGVRQTSLEEVFLKIARESEDAFEASS